MSAFAGGSQSIDQKNDDVTGIGELAIPFDVAGE